jgi:hypothetical protein
VRKYTSPELTAWLGLDLHPGRLPEFFPALRTRLNDKLMYNHKELCKTLERKAKV